MGGRVGGREGGRERGMHMYRSCPPLSLSLSPPPARPVPVRRLDRLLSVSLFLHCPVWVGVAGPVRSPTGGDWGREGDGRGRACWCACARARACACARARALASPRTHFRPTCTYIPVRTCIRERTCVRERTCIRTFIDTCTYVRTHREDSDEGRAVGVDCPVHRRAGESERERERESLCECV